MKKVKLLPLFFIFIVFVSACEELHDIFGDNKENIILTKDFKRMTDGLNGYNELFVNDRTAIFYKEKDNGLPSSLLILSNDEICDYFGYILFDEKGIPFYMNINNQSVYVENIKGNKYDLLIINSDKTFFQIKDVESEVDIENYWSNQSLTRSGYTQSNAQNAVCLLNHLMGGVTMIEGGAAMLVGCAMLVPGTNIAVGATIAIAGAAKFISGALTVTRATDLLVSDGSNTKNFDKAIKCLDVLSGIKKIFNTPKIQDFLTEIIDRGYDLATEMLFKMEDEKEIREKVKKIIEGRLLTGALKNIDYENSRVSLNGYISNKLHSNDKVGIYISTDPSASYVVNCGYAESDNSGIFQVSFDCLKDKTIYYYRSYYYLEEFNEYYVSSIKSFVMPGVETGCYENIDNSNYYSIAFTPLLNENGEMFEAGICYSTSNCEPTIDDDYVFVDVSENKEYFVDIELEESFCYYRAYLVLGERIVYGEVKELGKPSLSLYYANSRAAEEWIKINNGDVIDYSNYDDEFVFENVNGNGLNSRGYFVPFMLKNKSELTQLITLKETRYYDFDMHLPFICIDYCIPGEGGEQLWEIGTLLPGEELEFYMGLTFSYYVFYPTICSVDVVVSNGSEMIPFGLRYCVN